MCGIAGFWGPVDGAPDVIAARMAKSLAHRGPDDQGGWSDSQVGVALAHRRLSIVDLSSAGHQPMSSKDGRYVLVFNGEIYNHLSLRSDLDAAGAGGGWRGHSDTETLLAACVFWGLQGALERSAGMFALALWDREKCELSLARDRLGEKPLYYGVQGGCLLFGSELKALRIHPSFGAGVNRDALALLLRYNYIPAPHTIHEGICKLEPGTVLRFSSPHEQGGRTSFWSVPASIENVRHRAVPDPIDAVGRLEKLLIGAVGQQMVADVPLGAFLSGGIDSSLIVALMQAQATRPVKTFTIGFNEEGYNEAVHARAIARHLGTEHTELYVTPQQAMDVIPSLPQLYDEPFADVSQIPTFLVSRLARGQVAVALSGDGGDELFCGYTRYRLASRLWDLRTRFPSALRYACGAAVSGRAGEALLSTLLRLRAVLPARIGRGDIAGKLAMAELALKATSVLELNHCLSSFIQQPTNMLVGGREAQTVMTNPDARILGLNVLEQMMALDLQSYLPDDILAKIDRAAMAASLETRVPMLDRHVVEFALQLPLELKLRNGESKWILREILHRYVPRELFERPKMGFGVPMGAWLRGALRDWGESLLDKRRLDDEGYFDSASVRRCWDEHQSGRRDWQYALWGVLMFQQWREHLSGSANV